LDSLAVEKKKWELRTAMETPNLFEPETLKWKGRKKKLKSRRKKFKEGEEEKESQLENDKIIIEELKELENDDKMYEITFDQWSFINWSWK